MSMGQLGGRDIRTPGFRIESMDRMGCRKIFVEPGVIERCYSFAICYLLFTHLNCTFFRNRDPGILL